MATLKLEHIDKIYPNNVQAVFDFNLEVEDKEFIVLVGPSGCGKSTTLRMIAGLEEISEGKLFINDKLVNNVMPKDRDIAMVFQNYALYPHMTVFDNMAFGIKIRKHGIPVLDEEGKQVFVVDKLLIKDLKKQLWTEKNQENPDESIIKKLEGKIEELNLHPSRPSMKMVHYTKAEIKERVENAAEILGLSQYLDRKPAALSGGQRQRVALGRAIVRNASVFLMDEPLSNLDAKLRVQMRSEIAKIHQKVGATTIYVTHDQTEAMTMATRIVIMKDGYIQQIGTPTEVYENPANMFVASFIGAPSMNFISGTFLNGKFKIDDLLNNEEKFIKLDNKYAEILKEYEGQSIILGVRPEDMYAKEDKSQKHPGEAVKILCDIKELLGNELIVYGSICGQNIAIKTDSSIQITPHEEKEYVFNTEKICFFEKESGKRIR